MAYIWKFQPDVSFAVDEARGRWPYVTAVGNPETISEDQLTRLRLGGAKLVQRIAGDPITVQITLDKLAQTGLRFVTNPTTPPPAAWRTYTVQPGDTLSVIARQVYGQSQLWRIIFDANQDILTDPSRLRPGQVLKIPPKPE
ncbi:MAG: LysM peptidoglycan-binding domain-containing protein [Anaerolineales bacterium]|nr:LysM peptidoglycan-binding domain-containing protein [Anaerolineales bacterium]